MAGGLPARELFPRAALTRAFVAALSRPAMAPLQYGWPEGSQRLRAWIAARLWSRGASVHERDIIVTNGAQQALAIAVSALVERGDAIETDPETYPAALDLFRAHGLVLRARSSVTSDCVYTMPGIDNPRGLPMTPERRSDILAQGAPILADEAYAELCFSEEGAKRPLLADAPDRTWHIGTFSKTLSPGLRVGFLIPPQDQFERALRLKKDADLQACSLSQSILEEFLWMEDFDERLNRARRFYARRAERMVTALRKYFPSWRWEMPHGGFSVFVETDLEGDDTELLAVATECGVSFDPGRMFRADDRASPVAFRVCFSSLSPSSYDEAMRRVARAVLEWRKDRRSAPRLLAAHAITWARSRAVSGL